MKKIISGIILSALLCSCSAAMAATYNSEANTVTDDGAKDYQTVIITKKGDASDEGIVYVNQTSDGFFGTGTAFLIKEDPMDGFYAMTLGGGENGKSESSDFFIGTVTPGAEDEVMNTEVSFTEDNGDETYNAEFGWKGVDGSKVNTIILTLGNGKTMGCDLTGTVFAEGSLVNVGIKIKNIPDESGTASAYLTDKVYTGLPKANN